MPSWYHILVIHDNQLIILFVIQISSIIHCHFQYKLCEQQIDICFLIFCDVLAGESYWRKLLNSFNSVNYWNFYSWNFGKWLLSLYNNFISLVFLLIESDYLYNYAVNWGFKYTKKLEVYTFEKRIDILWKFP